MDYWLILLHSCFTNFCVNFIPEQFTGSVLILQITLQVRIFLTVSVFSFTTIVSGSNFFSLDQFNFFSFTVSGSHDYSLFLDQFLKSD